MRFTKAIREVMVAAIMRDVPDDRKEIFAELKPKVEQFFIDLLPDSVALAYAEHPEYIETRRVGIWSTASGSRWNVGTYDFSKNTDVPYNGYDYDNILEEQAWYTRYKAQLDATTQRIDKAFKEATAALNSVTTAKRLRELYPNLAKYLPTEISGTALTVPQSLPDLHSAGWPKERSHEAREQVPESPEAEA